jgi:hypothetical protein
MLYGDLIERKTNTENRLTELEKTKMEFFIVTVTTDKGETSTARQTMPVKVPYTQINANKCLCWTCHAHTSPNQIKPTAGNSPDLFNRDLVNPPVIPILFCSTDMTCWGYEGKTEGCICSFCPVFEEYRLVAGKPKMFYCRNGRAR